MKKKAFSQFAFEFLSIVFAVLLALGLNSYKQNYDLKNEGKILRIKIIEECKGNKQRLDSVIIENQAMLEYVDSLMRADNVTGFGFSIAGDMILSSAWKFTQSSRAYQSMDKDFLNSATELYEVQSNYMDAANYSFKYAGDIMLRIDKMDQEQIFQVLQFYLSNLLEVSVELQEYYQEFLATYSEVNP